MLRATKPYKPEVRSKSKTDKLLRSTDGKYRVRDHSGQIREITAERWLRFWRVDRVIEPLPYLENGALKLSRVAALLPDYVLVCDEAGELVARRKEMPEPGVRLKTWWEVFFAQWLRSNPQGRYSTLEDIRRAIAEEFYSVG